MHKERINYEQDDPTVIAYVIGRDEGPNLPMVFEAILDQTLKASTLLFIDDHSLDESSEIADRYGFRVVRVAHRHPSYTGRPELGQIWNLGIRREDPSQYDFMIQCSSDVILSPNYLEQLTGHMMKDPGLVIASGIIEGEYTYSSHARGTGRLYRSTFWNEFIREFPPIFAWESYPLFKAQALGYRVRSFPDLKMKAIRPTHPVKALYGTAMRELGYWPPYAIGRTLLMMMKDPRAGSRMLSHYLKASGPYDPELARTIRNLQIRRFREVLLRFSRGRL